MSAVDQLADLLDRSFHGGPWHGPAVAEVLDGVDAERAAARPIAEAHTIWEIVHHLTAWNEVPRQRIDGERVGEIAEEADWAPAKSTDEEAWRQAVAGLEESHRRLHARLAELDDEDLERPVAGSEPTVRGLIVGVLQHNSYHAGQIVLLRKALGKSR